MCLAITNSYPTPNRIMLSFAMCNEYSNAIDHSVGPYHTGLHISRRLMLSSIASAVPSTLGQMLHK